MVSKRIKTISSFLNKNDLVLDVGTDHALLPVYSVLHDIVCLIDGSDISEKVLDNAKRNISKYNLDEKISLFLSDGLKSIDISRYNTLVICGMGFYTIKNILNNANLSDINKMIIQPNNHYADFRVFITSIGYKIDEEVYINDYGKDYVIFIIKKGNQNLTESQKLAGIYNKNNGEYYKKQIVKINDLNNKISDANKKEENLKLINIYQDYLTKEKIEENY